MNRLVGPMKLRPSSLLLFTALSGVIAVPAMSQNRPAGVPPAPAPRATVPPKPKTVAPAAPVAGNPDFKADQPQAQVQAAPVPPPLPPAIWDMPSVLELAAYINQIGVEGLNPADYDLPG